MKYDVINHKTNDCIWYHTTTKDRLDSILSDGLKINSQPHWQSKPEPWIYLSPQPWSGGDVVLEVDLSGFSEDENRSEVGWAFIDNWEDRWQLRVFVDIPPDRIKMLPEVE